LLQFHTVEISAAIPAPMAAISTLPSRSGTAVSARVPQVRCRAAPTAVQMASRNVATTPAATAPVLAKSSAVRPAYSVKRPSPAAPKGKSVAVRWGASRLARSNAAPMRIARSAPTARKAMSAPVRKAGSIVAQAASRATAAAPAIAMNPVPASETRVAIRIAMAFSAGTTAAAEPAVVPNGRTGSMAAASRRAKLRENARPRIAPSATALRKRENGSA